MWIGGGGGGAKGPCLPAKKRERRKEKEKRRAKREQKKGRRKEKGEKKGRSVAVIPANNVWSGVGQNDLAPPPPQQT